MMKKEKLGAKEKSELGKLLLQLGFRKDAATEFLFAARLYEEAGDIENAVSMYNQILQIDRGNEVAKKKLSQLSLQKPLIQGKKQTEEKSIRSIEKKAPKETKIEKKKFTLKPQVLDEEQKKIPEELFAPLKHYIDRSKCSKEDLLNILNILVAARIRYETTEIAKIFVKHYPEEVDDLFDILDSTVSATYKIPLLKSIESEMNEKYKKRVYEMLLSAYEEIGDKREISYYRSLIGDTNAKQKETAYEDKEKDLDNKKDETPDNKKKKRVHFI